MYIAQYINNQPRLGIGHFFQGLDVSEFDYNKNYIFTPDGNKCKLSELDALTYLYMGKEFSVFPKIPVELSLIFLEGGQALILLTKGALVGYTDLNGEEQSFSIEYDLTTSEKAFLTRLRNGGEFKNQEMVKVDVSRLLSAAQISKFGRDSRFVGDYLHVFEVKVIDFGVSVQHKEVLYDFSCGEINKLLEKERLDREVLEEEREKKRLELAEKRRERELFEYNERKKKLEAEESLKEERKAKMKNVKPKRSSGSSKKPVKEVKFEQLVVENLAKQLRQGIQ